MSIPSDAVLSEPAASAAQPSLVKTATESTAGETTTPMTTATASTATSSDCKSSSSSSSPSSSGKHVDSRKKEDLVHHFPSNSSLQQQKKHQDQEYNHQLQLLHRHSSSLNPGSQPQGSDQKLAAVVAAAEVAASMYDAYQAWALKTYGDSAKTKTVTKKKYNRIMKILRGEESSSVENSKFRFWVKAKGFRIAPDLTLSNERSSSSSSSALREEVLYVPAVKTKVSRIGELCACSPLCERLVVCTHDRRPSPDHSVLVLSLSLLRTLLLIPCSLSLFPPSLHSFLPLNDDMHFILYKHTHTQADSKQGNSEELSLSCYKRVAVVENFYDIIYNVHVEMDGRSGKHAGQKRTYRAVSSSFPRSLLLLLSSPAPFP